MFSYRPPCPEIMFISTRNLYIHSVTLIGIATGGLECDLELLLSCIHDVMVFCIGKKELENLKNLDQIKRDLRQCYPILDYLLESLDTNTVPRSTIVLDFIQSFLCPQAQQLQVMILCALNSYKQYGGPSSKVV